MPHINRIRVNNVKYNFGTQFYDDFLMRFSCKNTIYDLANGGGKSVLMLLLLQNLIPNCTLDDKQPVEKLFRTNEGSTTIHSMIEWSLSDVHVKDGFKYMLTGFCARKAKDLGIENQENVPNLRSGTSIEYFNYCIFYRTFNDNDIKNLPLSHDGERVTYSGLKNYLKDLQKKDYGLEVKIFDRKGDYQRFIAEYGLYESQWEIIRGINKTEGHVRTYFETNYRTTRKVVEDLLIEEIIEKSFHNKYSDDDSKENLSETLLNIKDKLLELSEKKEQINNYDRQIEIINGFAERVSSIKQLYTGIEEAFTNLKRADNSLDNAIDEAQKSMEHITSEIESVVSQKNQLSKKVETAKVLVDMKELDRLTHTLEKENESFAALEEEMHEINQKLNIYEGGNYYLEYIECKKSYDKLKKVMDNLFKGNTALIRDLKCLVAAKKIYDDNRREALAKDLEQEKDTCNREKEALILLENESREADNRHAILTYEIASCEKELEKLDKKITELKNITSLLLPTDAAEQLIINNKKLEETDKIIEEKKEECKKAENKIMSLTFELQKKKYELSELNEKKDNIKEKSNRSLNDYEKIVKIKEVYGENDIDKLILNIQKIYRNMVSANNKTAMRIKNMEDLLVALESGKGCKESSELSSITDYIRRYHTPKALSGVEYIGTLNDDERVKIIRDCPFLPYSVIVYDNYHQVIMDSKLRSMPEIEGSGGVAIINGEELVTEEAGNLINLDKITYICLAPEEYTAEKIQKRIEKLQKEREELNKKYLRQCENEEVVKEDYLFLCRLADNNISENEMNPDVCMEGIENSIKQLSQETENLTCEIQEAEKQKEIIRLSINEKEGERKNITDDIQVLKHIAELMVKRGESEKRLSACKSEEELLSKELKDRQKRYEALLNMNNRRSIRINSLKEEEDNLDSIWDKSYKMYFDEKVFNDIVNNGDKRKKLLAKDLDVELQAILESIRQDNYAVADKEKLLSNYQISMQRSLEHIDYMGVDIDIFENMYKNNELIKTTSEELMNIKHKSSDCRNKERKQRKYIQNICSERDCLQGKINHAISVISEKYGEFRKDIISDSEINTFLNEKGTLLLQLENMYDSLTRNLKEYENKIVSLGLLKRDVTKLMDKSEIKPDKGAGMFGSDTDVEKACKEAAEKLDSFIEEKYKRRENFERDMSLLNDTLKKLNAHELASEIRMNVNMPADLQETEELIDMLNETTEYIDLEKQRIIKGLDDIQIIKDNFENQCIQSCINIKTELDRLSKLSRITMDGENISVINLRIPYVKEEFYKERMSDYIDRIAKGTDSFETGEDKLKYIRNNLCWKKMFSVIVSDMNGIKLNLYKRERIADQSRYLPYEEAVGSTGQSQGIYIQFLIAIINYISGINSKNADSSRLKKVVFIDNPFGAAKDVYIWEPIFRLLKTNNVQLIVPARGATPAITGRFDVNYVLGQKMCDGRQQTVVVDYYSNVNNDELDYTTLVYEQAELSNDGNVLTIR